jgi:hypothetical protein
MGGFEPPIQLTSKKLDGVLTLALRTKPGHGEVVFDSTLLIASSVALFRKEA